MHKKLWITYVTVIAVTIIFSWGAFWSKGHSYMERQNEDNYMTQAVMLGELIKNTEGNVDDFVKEKSDAYGFRITLISSDGKVAADSSYNDVTAMDNHGARNEVSAAMKGKRASAVRYSGTMKMYYFYAAVPVSNSRFHGVLRISLPLEELKNLDRNLLAFMLLSVLAAVVAALFMAYLFTRYLTEPFNEVVRVAEEIAGGNYGGKIYTKQKDQIGRLAEAFNHMSLKLKDNIERLTDKNMELETILSSMVSSVAAVDNMNKILFHNRAFLRLLEHEGSEVSGKELYAVVRNVLLFDVIDKVRKTGKECKKEGTFRVNEEKIIRVMGTPLYREEENIGVLLVIEDITELKKLENMRSDFVSNVTHELKTPLTSIRGFVDTLKNGAIKEEKVAKTFLDIIDIETERLYGLIQDILLLSEIESVPDRDLEPCDVNEVIEEVAAMLAPKTGDDVKITYDRQPYLKPYKCNPDRIKQLLINLVDNAVKNTLKGSVTISAKWEGEEFILTVADTGIGIPEESQTRIFERFYRVDKGRSRKQGGTGLGLSIVKHIVEMYGGNISLESEVGKGTTFIITL